MKTSQTHYQDHTKVNMNDSMENYVYKPPLLRKKAKMKSSLCTHHDYAPVINPPITPPPTPPHQLSPKAPSRQTMKRDHSFTETTISLSNSKTKTGIRDTSNQYILSDSSISNRLFCYTKSIQTPNTPCDPDEKFGTLQSHHTFFVNKKKLHPPRLPPIDPALLMKRPEKS